MNLFRSEEHVKQWSLYYRSGEDYVMPVEDWAEVFSGPLFRNRLEPDYLEHGEEYLAQYHADLERMGKASPLQQLSIIEEMHVINLSRFRVVGNYARYEEQVLNDLKDAKSQLVASIAAAGTRRENYLIWAAPGTGKTFFVQEIARDMADEFEYKELNLAKATEDSFRDDLESLRTIERRCLCLIDEVDSHPQAQWPYEALLPYLDAAAAGEIRVVFVMAGSSGFSLQGIKQRIRNRPKGSDLLSRIPSTNQFLIHPMSFGDRALIVMSQFLQAGRELGREIRSIEKLALYYIARNPELSNARQLYEFVVRAAGRVPRGDDRVKYDHLFDPGDPENKRFWMNVSDIAGGLTNSFVMIRS